MGTPLCDGAPRGTTVNGANAKAVSVFAVIAAATMMATTEGRSRRGGGGQDSSMKK